MKKALLLAAASATVLTSTVLAGQVTHEVDKNPVPPAPAPAVFGTGWYFGLQAGINAYQDYGDSREFHVGNRDVRIDRNSDVGFVGGLKLGYVFGTGTVRPAIEADLYYNGVRGDIDVHCADINADAKLHTGAFMGNFLLRFAFDRFQPYVGGGVGAWVGEAQDIDVTVRGHHRKLDNVSDNGFAWQIVGGADYYFTEKFSAFAEYKFLNYEDAGFEDDRIGQHLVVLGLRFHF